MSQFGTVIREELAKRLAALGAQLAAEDLAELRIISDDAAMVVMGSMAGLDMSEDLAHVNAQMDRLGSIANHRLRRTAWEVVESVLRRVIVMAISAGA